MIWKVTLRVIQLSSATPPRVAGLNRHLASACCFVASKKAALVALTVLAAFAVMAAMEALYGLAELVVLAALEELAAGEKCVHG